ncbi:hypothetical protein NXV15_23965 [Bacteroides thetaiotaomicron]|nr:hypothetical protein [Bacteroides thetaiotaomicron]MCS2687400.1 hypothetical protein [Bacteroides thetaiotaomicron]
MSKTVARTIPSTSITFRNVTATTFKSWYRTQEMVESYEDKTETK